jgi:diguanylate cyclase (GGDEF)-like protein
MLEVLSWGYDCRPGYFHINYFLNFIFALSTSIVPCLWACYIDYHMFESFERLRVRWFYSYPFFLNMILLIINFFKPIIFSVSDQNVYSREPGMLLMAIINLSLFIHISSIAYKERHRIQKEVVWVILLYVLMPVVVAFLQTALFGVFILWPTMAATLVLTYIFLETVSTSRDYLTGLLTRSRIDGYLEYLISHDKPFLLVMIDLDKFKEINDTYGHLEGDQALKQFASVLSRTFVGERLIGRYAGDEFILILEKHNSDDVRTCMQRIHNEMKSYYNEGHLKFEVDFSYGYYDREPQTSLTYAEVVGFADARMYLQKKSKEY